MKKILLFLSAIMTVYFSNAQNVGIGTNLPKALLHVNEGNVVFANSGGIGTYLQTPVTGSGRRMMWYADKAAFRAGYADGGKWDRDSIGNYSVAMGNSTVAKGNYATATGDRSAALGNSSFATGSFCSALGNNSFAPGYSATAYNSYSTAIGFSATVTGDYSLAIGQLASASGDKSTSIGSSTSASGLGSTAMGVGSKASAPYNVAIGHNLINYGVGSMVIGRYNRPVLTFPATGIFSSSPLFIIGNGDSEALRSNALLMTANGKLGIGTDVPEANLHISHLAGGGLILENANDNNKWRIYSASGDNNLTFYNNADVEVADIDDVSGAFNAISDSRLKKNIETMLPVLPSLIKLKPSYYQFNWQQQTDQKQIGLLAQEAHQFFPELVSYNKEKDLYKMNYAGFSVVAIKAIQEQQVIINNLQKQIAFLQKETEKINSLGLKIAAIEKLLLSNSSEVK